MPSASIIEQFGAVVRNLRFRLGISQEELAERADLHRTYIAGIERGGRNITLKSIAKLAKALEVSTADLLSPGQDVVTQRGGSSRKHTTERIVDILLVEDNPDDVELTLQAFREVRIANHIQVVSDGAMALDYLFCTGTYANRSGKSLPQVILLDLQLPKVSGLEVLRRVKRDPRTRHIPVIVLTLSQKSRDIAECQRLGAQTYIVKPVDFYNFCQVTPQLRFQWALFSPVSRARA
jgi:CheY-like chemotaxis protein/DNA-binding XRE family transcriptional regulator